MTEKAKATKAQKAGRVKAAGRAARARKKSVTAEPVTPEPVTPEAAASEPVNPEAVAAEPAIPEPAIPEPAIPEPVLCEGIDLAELAGIAALYVPVDDAAELLGVDAVVLQAMLDDPATPHACTWRKGRAGARRAVRKAQFDLMGKNASLAIHMGRELLGQDGGGPAGPMTFLVDDGISGGG